MEQEIIDVTSINDAYDAIEYDNLDIDTNQFGEVARSAYPSDILQLTPFDSGNNAPASYGVIAEYNDIDTKQITQKHVDIAKSFVDKIETFVLNFNDVSLTEQHREYIRVVSKLQIQDMVDLMSLVDINKQMIDNIIARVNASQAEDYTIIASYSNLVNQHLKLMKELRTVYKAIPSTIKKMRVEILQEGETDSTQALDGVITDKYGETQFNSGKEMLKKILENKKQQEARNSAS